MYESEISERLSQPGVAIGLASFDTSHVLFQPAVYESETSERLSQPGVAIGLACFNTPCFVSACGV